jgi:hypothetical protein
MEARAGESCAAYRAEAAIWRHYSLMPHGVSPSGIVFTEGNSAVERKEQSFQLQVRDSKLQTRLLVRTPNRCSSRAQQVATRTGAWQEALADGSAVFRLGGGCRVARYEDQIPRM